MSSIIPSILTLHKKSQELELKYNNGQSYRLSSAMLRVLSPSAEVKKILPVKNDVKIIKIEMVGNYAIKITYDDGHNSGLYNWVYLYNLCVHKKQYLEDYARKLHKIKDSYNPDVSIVRLVSIN